MLAEQVMSKAPGARRWGWMSLGLPLLAAACGPLATPKTANTAPLPSMGKATQVSFERKAFIVVRSPLASASHGEVLRVYRGKAPALTYSDGLLAKNVVEAFCANFNRTLAPESLGMFEPVGDWVFPGGCT